VFLKREHVELLIKIKEGKKANVPMEIISKRMLELRLQGLLEDNEPTEAGKLIADAFHDVDLSKLEDPVVNSEIIKILELKVETEYAPEKWEKILKARALDDKERAEKVLLAYKKAKPSIFITPYIAEFLLRIPPGPGMLSELTNFAKTLGYGYNIIHALEAMRWIKISPETRGRVYVLTPLGRRIRAILSKYPVSVPNILLNERIVKALAKIKEKSESELQELVLLGLVAHGTETPIAKELVGAYKSEEIVPPVAPIYVTREEMQTLRVVIDAKKKGILATESYIKKKTGLGADVLHVLESKGWVIRKEVKNKDTYEVTEEGARIFEYFGKLAVDIPAEAVKAITYTMAGDVPIAEWVQLAQKHGLVAGDVTKRGRVLYEAAKKMVRLPLLTGYDAAVLAKTPRRKSVPAETLIKEISEYVKAEALEKPHPRLSLERTVRIALSEAESRGYIVVLQNDVVKLTKAGDLMKSVLEYGKAHEIIHTKFAITPTTYHILRVIHAHEKDLKKIWREVDENVVEEKVKLVYNELKRYTSITVEEVIKYLKIMRRIGLLGDMGITKAGQYLLEAGHALATQ